MTTETNEAMSTDYLADRLREDDVSPFIADQAADRMEELSETIDDLTAVLSAAYAAFLAGHTGDLKDIFERYWEKL